MATTITAVGCARETPADAYGNVEATAVVVGAEASGRLVSFDPKEGDTLAAGAIAGTIDSTELGLQRDQLAAQRAANASRVNEIARQVSVIQAQRDAATAQREAIRADKSALETQLVVARRTFERTERLFAQQAATSQQLDQAEREVRVLEQQITAKDEQIKAQESQIRALERQVEATHAQRETAAQQVAVAAGQVAQVDQRIRKSQIANPIAGTVLTTYARAGEFVQQGQPLYKIADLKTVEVRAYISEPQLSLVKIGATAQVSIDAGPQARRAFPGTVTWVASEAEFTPTPIQTKDERADLVYAVKLRVPNDDGALKIGMPVDVQFGSQ